VVGVVAAAAVSVAAVAEAANVAVFFNTAFVDTATDGTGEAYNVVQTLTSQGHTVSTFTSLAPNVLGPTLLGKSVLVIPELENGNLTPTLSGATTSIIHDFVFIRGGTLVVFAPATGDPLAVLNVTFKEDPLGGKALSLTSAGDAVGSITKAAGAAGTTFANGPATLPILSATSTVELASLPVGSQLVHTNVIYEDDNGNAVVTQISYGSGHILIIGWDWFDAAPTGAQDGGWLALLDTTVTVPAGPPVPVPTLSEWAMIALAALLVVTGLRTLRRSRSLA
jgi:hypothetical protein